MNAHTFLRLVLSLLLLCGVNAYGAAKKILVVTQSKGFTHSGVKRPASGDLCLVEKTLQEIAQTSGIFETVNSQNASEVLTRDNLKKFDAVFFYTTGDLLSASEDRDALLDFVKSGKGFIGAHSATDTYPGFKPYIEMINGNFDGHPWNAPTICTFTNHEPSHPAVKMYPAEFQWKDEIYQYKMFDPGAVRVLLSLDMSKTNPKMPWHVPVAWVRDYGDGRLFYTNLGHNDSTWRDEKFREHLLAGIRWALKLEDGPAKPNPMVHVLENAKSFLVVATKAQPDAWQGLLAKVEQKGKADPGFLKQLNADITAFRKLPTLDAKKAGREEFEAAENRRKEATSKILDQIEK